MPIVIPPAQLAQNPMLQDDLLQSNIFYEKK